MLSVRDKGALRLDEWRWRCEGCGAKHDCDVNATNNIEAEGLRILMHPEETGGVCASGGEGEGPDRTRARGRVSANQPSGVNGVRNTANDATAEFRKQTSGETPIPRSESLSAAAATAIRGPLFAKCARFSAAANRRRPTHQSRPCQLRRILGILWKSVENNDNISYHHTIIPSYHRTIVL